MRTKRLKVGIRSVEEGLKEFGVTLKALQSGKKVRKRAGVYFVSVEAMRRILHDPSLGTVLDILRYETESEQNV